MNLWEELEIKDESAKELKLNNLKEPSEKDFIKIMCYAEFGGVCNKKEIKQITNIVYKAYLRTISKGKTDERKA